jgi:hypothetical protein
MTRSGSTSPIDRSQLAVSGVVYHLPSSLGAYGDTAGYDLGNAVGLLRFVVDFVNRKPEPYKYGTTQVMPVGREPLQQLLRVAVRGPSLPSDLDLQNPTDEAIENIRGRISRIHWEHQLEWTPTGVEWRHHAHILDAESFYWLIVTLLMNADTRASLAQCRCEQFFVLDKAARGRPQMYHNEECATAANAATADERQRNLRKRRAAAAIVKGSSASEARIQDAIKQAFKDDPSATPKQLAERAKSIIKAAQRGKK